MAPDVFLTTLKPQQKVVTAEDIESSLYYVHVDSAKDADLLDSDDEGEGIDLQRMEVNEGPFTAQGVSEPHGSQAGSSTTSAYPGYRGSRSGLPAARTPLKCQGGPETCGSRAKWD